MLIKEISKYIEDWAPAGAAWENDNVGFQVTADEKELSNILLCLDVTFDALKEAKKKNCNLVVSHHPLIFKPLKKIDPANDEKSAMIEFALKNGISIFSAHTNLDFTKEGVSFALARKLELNDIEFLTSQKGNQFKIVVFIPENDLLKVSKAAFEEGAGIIGEYKNCSFRLNGLGTFHGSDFSNPYIGEKNNLKEVPEIRLEVLVDKWKLEKVIEKMIKAHPYEQPAYDVYELKNRNANYGAGAIGFLQQPVNADFFLQKVSSSINPNLKFSKSKKKKISKVAVCGGSGSNLLGEAIQNGADAFITADIKYHTFQDAENKILLIDAGHYETEIPVLEVLKRRLTKYLRDRKSGEKVFKFSQNRNPVNYFVKNLMIS